MFFIETGNHHLFLILKTQSNQEWIALLGKRKPNFPFFGVRFENATFYNVAAHQLYHHSTEEMKDLEFRCGDDWELIGNQPIPFSLRLKPTSLKKRSHFFGRVVFNYHLLEFKSGNIGGESIGKGHGFSEQGQLHILKKPKILFDYLLLLDRQTNNGFLKWKSTLPFLCDQLNWGTTQLTQNQPQLETLATTNIPLKDWILKREIVKKTVGNIGYYGLKESFHLQKP